MPSEQQQHLGHVVEEEGDRLAEVRARLEPEHVDRRARRQRQRRRTRRRARRRPPAPTAGQNGTWARRTARVVIGGPRRAHASAGRAGRLVALVVDPAGVDLDAGSRGRALPRGACARWLLTLFWRSPRAAAISQTQCGPSDEEAQDASARSGRRSARRSPRPLRHRGLADRGGAQAGPAVRVVDGSSSHAELSHSRIEMSEGHRSWTAVPKGADMAGRVVGHMRICHLALPYGRSSRVPSRETRPFPGDRLD